MPECAATALGNTAESVTVDAGGARYLLYYRQRLGEPVASEQALRQQNDIRARLVATGATIVGTFTDYEAAPPGTPEPRPALPQAYAAAAGIAIAGGKCELVVLRVDAIGGGDPFPMFGLEAGMLDSPGHPVPVRYPGCAAFDRQLRHEWRHAMGNADPSLEPGSTPPA